MEGRNNKIKEQSSTKLKTEKKEKNQIISRFYEKISKISKPCPDWSGKRKELSKLPTPGNERRDITKKSYRY